MKTKYLTRTALLIALLVAIQYVTRAAGQFVTGSCVNLILAVSAAVCPLGWALSVALLSPLFAFLLGIGTPLLPIVPAIALGNGVYVFLLHLLDCHITFSGGRIVSVLVAAVTKFLVLWAVVAGLMLPLLPLPDVKAAALAVSFSWPQLVTALIGGIVSIPVILPLKKIEKQ